MFIVLSLGFVCFQIKRYCPISDVYSPAVKRKYLVNPMMYFLQVSPLVLTSVSRGRLSSAMTAVFSLSSSSSGGFNWNLCLFRDLTVLDQVVLESFIPGCLVLSVIAAAAVTSLSRTMQSSRGGVVATGLFVVDLTYGAVLKTTLILLRCVQVRNISVLWVSGETLCYTSWQYGLMLVTVLLSLFPVFKMVLALRVRRGASAVQQALWQALCAPLKDDKRYLVGQFLLRRLAFSVVSVFSASALGEAYGLLVLSVVFAFLEYLTAPFRHAVVQHVATISQVALVILAAGNAVTVAESDPHLDSDTLSAATALTVIALVFPTLVALVSFYKPSAKPVRRLVRFLHATGGVRDSEAALVCRDLMLHPPEFHKTSSDCSYRSQWLASHWRTLSLKLLDTAASMDNAGTGFRHSSRPISLAVPAEHELLATRREKAILLEFLLEHSSTALPHIMQYSDLPLELMDAEAIVGFLRQNKPVPLDDVLRPRLDHGRLSPPAAPVNPATRFQVTQRLRDYNNDRLPPPPPLVVSPDAMWFEPKLPEDVQTALLNPDAQADHVIV